MFRHFFRTAFRHASRNKLETFINIGGMAVALAVVILIALFVRDELSFDQMWADSDRIFRVENTIIAPGRNPEGSTGSPGPLMKALEDDFGDRIEAVSRLYGGLTIFRIDEEAFQQRVFYVDAGFFDIFDLPMVVGEARAAVGDNLSVILSETAARRYFGDKNPVGQVVPAESRFDDGTFDFKIVGIFADLPSNTHLELEAIALFDEARYVNRPWVAERWLSPNVYTYVLLNEDVTAGSILGLLPEFTDRQVQGPLFGSDTLKGSDVLKFHMLNVRDIQLGSTRQGNIREVGSMERIYAFSTIALLILLVAGLNYVNLSTARATNRAPEIAMCKVMGARQKQLAAQFVGESVLQIGAALAVALVLARLALPYFNEFLGREIALLSLTGPYFLAGLTTFTGFVGMAAGIYPALVLAAFRPSHVLGSKSTATRLSARFRTVLVVAQYAVAIGLIIATSVVYGQAQFARYSALGFKPDNRILIDNIPVSDNELREESLKAEIEKLPGVRQAALANNLLPRRNTNRWSFRADGGSSDEVVLIDAMEVDSGYFETYGFELIAGRFLSEHVQNDRMDIPDDAENRNFEVNVVLNESAALSLGLPGGGDAIGQVFFNSRRNDNGVTVTYRVAGLIRDTRVGSALLPAPPAVFINAGNIWQQMVIKVEPGRLAEVERDIDALWRSMVPEVPITRQTVQERIDGLYEREDEYVQLLTVFAAITVLVSGMGLLGLSAFMAERRTKEIGIRKVLGAEVRDIVRMLVWQLSKPVVVANLIAWPIAWFVLQSWLEGYAYRMEMSFTIFAVSGLAALVIAWVTVSTHAVRAARSSPVNALKCE